MNFRLIGLVLFLLALTIVGCGGGDGGSDGDGGGGHFVYDYTPNLTEPKGTVYYDDYFPFETGYVWKWGGNETVSLSGDELSVSVFGTMEVFEPENINLDGTDYILYPIEEYAISSGGYSPAIRRYFENIDGTVYIRAVQVESGEILKIEDPVFIKHPIEVGDSWEAAPRADFDKMFTNLMDSSISECGGGIPSIDIDITSKIYVVGKEMKASRETIRLDQRALATGIVTIPNMGSLHFNIKITDKMNLQKDIGIVASSRTLDLKASGTLKCWEETGVIDEEMSIDSNLRLSSYNFDFAITNAENFASAEDNSEISTSINDFDYLNSIRSKNDYDTKSDISADSINVALIRLMKLLMINK